MARCQACSFRVTSFLAAYRRMRLIREFEERVHDEFSAGNIPGFVHLYAGEEASGVGVCMHLDDRDAIASTHRGHGHCIAKGCDIDGMMHEIFGRKDGLCGGKGGSMHIADLSKGMLGANGIVGAGAPLGLRRGADGEDAEDRRRRRLLLRRRRLQPGRGAGELQPRENLEPADGVRGRGQRLRGIDRLVAGRSAAARSAAATASASPRARSTGRTSSRSTRRRARRSSGRAPAKARRCCT